MIQPCEKAALPTAYLFRRTIQGNNHTCLLLLLLQVISLWINALLSDVVIIIIKLTQMTRAATLLIHGAAPVVGQNNAGLARLFGTICGWEENRV
jgi:hypothetical protein